MCRIFHIFIDCTYLALHALWQYTNTSTINQDRWEEALHLSVLKKRDFGTPVDTIRTLSETKREGERQDNLSQ